MQINQISNINGFGNKNNTQNTVKIDLNQFLNASDNELYTLAKQDYKKKHKNNTAKFIGACVGVDVASNIILKNKVAKNINGQVIITKAPLSAKIGAGAKALKGWGMGFAAVGALMAIKNGILNKNKNFTDFEQQHPTGAFLAEIGSLALTYTALKSAVGKTNLGNLAAKMSKPFKNFANKIDNTKLVKFTMDKSSTIANTIGIKAPLVNKSLRFLLSNSVLIMFLAGLSNIKKENNEVEKTFQNLKIAQTQILNTNFD